MSDVFYSGYLPRAEPLRLSLSRVRPQARYGVAPAALPKRSPQTSPLRRRPLAPGSAPPRTTLGPAQPIITWGRLRASSLFIGNAAIWTRSKRCFIYNLIQYSKVSACDDRFLSSLTGLNGLALSYKFAPRLDTTVSIGVSVQV